MKLTKVGLVCGVVVLAVASNHQVLASAPAQNDIPTLLCGFNPDPTICRVGADYYLATSSFELLPGIPIYNSTNLVDWTVISHAWTQKRPCQSARTRPSPSGATGSFERENRT